MSFLSKQINTLTAEELWKVVDKELDKSNIPKGGLNSELVRFGVERCLDKMIKSSHFSVCAIDDAAKLAQIKLSPERKAFYTAIHCVNWDELANKRNEIILMIMDDFRSVLNPK